MPVHDATVSYVHGMRPPRWVVTVVEEMSESRLPRPIDILLPTDDVVKLARAVLTSGRFTITRMDSEETVRAKHIWEHDDDNDELASLMALDDSSGIIRDTSMLDQQEREKASAYYSKSINWSMKMAHYRSMPDEGQRHILGFPYFVGFLPFKLSHYDSWLSHLEHGSCRCRYYTKFGSCVHHVAARISLNLVLPGAIDTTTKFKNRKRKAPPEGQDTQVITPAAPIGRPTSMSTALTIEYILS